MRSSLLLTLTLGLVFGLGQAVRVLPHGCDSYGVGHSHERDLGPQLHAHCDVCDFVAPPFEPAASAAIIGIEIPRCAIARSSQLSLALGSSEAVGARGPPSA